MDSNKYLNHLFGAYICIGIITIERNLLYRTAAMSRFFSPFGPSV